MSPDKSSGTCGNLYSYKLYTRPTARKLFGEYTYRRRKLSKHQEYVQRMLHVLALNGPMTTWAMAKVDLLDDTEMIRSREKQYRKLLVGRVDRGKRSSGVLDIGIVMLDGKSTLRAPANVYRLSLHGILYCMDVLNLTNREMDRMAQNYSHVLPWVFGRWKYLKSIMGNDVYKIRLLGKGLLLDNAHITLISKFPVYEILTYLAVKYQSYFEYINEKDLAEQISLWYYTHLLIPSDTTARKQTASELKQWHKLFTNGDKEIKHWYQEFLDEAVDFYKKRFSIVKKLKKL
jgi:hypothetical protein